MGAALWSRRLPDTLEEWPIVLGVTVVVILLPFYLQWRRRLGMQRAAQEMGFSFDPTGMTRPSDHFMGLPLLERATATSNLLRGSVASGDAVVLDCKIGSGRSARTVTVVCLRLAGKELPNFELKPEGLLHKLGAALGQQDIDFESSPGFSSKYVLRGQDEAAVREVFHPGLLSFLEQNKGWSVEGAGEWLAVYKSERSVGASKLKEFVQEAAQVGSAFL